MKRLQSYWGSQFTGEEKITRLYTEMLPEKGAEGLKKFMRILYDTGWDTPSHMRHHGMLSIKLSVSELVIDLYFIAAPLGQAFTDQECWVST